MDWINGLLSYCQLLLSTAILFALVSLIRISKENDLILDVLGLLLVLEIDDIIAQLYPLYHPNEFDEMMCDKELLEEQERLTTIDPFENLRGSLIGQLKRGTRMIARAVVPL